MLINDAVLVDLCAKLYTADQDDGAFWDDLLWPESDHGICVGVKRLGPDDVAAVWRGSVTPLDWFRDFISELFHEMPGFSELGDVALGFSEDMPEVYMRLIPILTSAKRVWIVGHRLDAARAQF